MSWTGTTSQIDPATLPAKWSKFGMCSSLENAMPDPFGQRLR